MKTSEKEIEIPDDFEQDGILKEVSGMWRDHPHQDDSGFR